MAVIHTSYRNLGEIQAALNSKSAAGADLVNTYVRGQGAFNEFYNGFNVTSETPSEVRGSVVGGGTFVARGTNLDSSPATITYVRYNDNSPKATFEIFGNVTGSDTSITGNFTRMKYDSSLFDFDFKGNINIQKILGGLLTFSFTDFSAHVVYGPTDIKLAYEGSATYKNGAFSGTIDAASLEVDGRYIRATDLNGKASLISKTTADSFMSTLLAGDDTIFGHRSDQTLNGYGGNDTINAHTGNDVLNGGNGNDVLNGGKGKDTLDGGSGNDKMNGGAGNDTYVVGSAGDAVTEAPDAGTDLVKSSVAYTLGQNVEKLTLTGSADIAGSGNGGDNVIEGNSGDNILNGKGGNDTLNGGAGSDTLIGGSGDDTLAWDEADTSVNGGTGTDTLRLAGENVQLNLPDLDIAGSKITDVEVIDISSGETTNNLLVLTHQEVLDLSTETDTLRVDGNEGDQLLVEDSEPWMPWAQIQVGEILYHKYTLNGATLLVDIDIDITILTI